MFALELHDGARDGAVVEQVEQMDPALDVDRRTAVPEDSASNESLPFLVEEIEEVEQLISLQNRKLRLLRALRYRALAGERLDALQLQSVLSDGNRTREGDTPEWSKHLVKEMQLELDYAIVASVVMVTKVKRMPGQHGSEVLLGLVDTEGYLHIVTTMGEEVLLYHLAHSHAISAIAFDGTDVKKTIFVSAATDGSVHIMSMEVSRNTSLSAEKSVMVNMSVLFRYKLNEVIPALVETASVAPVNASAAYVTSLLVYVKQSVKSFVLLVGDSVGRVTLCSLLGESFDVNVINPGEPIASMTRLGTLVAIAAGHNVHIHVMGRFELPAKICRSGGDRDEDKILQISMDMGSNPYLFAKTFSGKVLSFDTKSRGKNEISGKPDVFCVLLSALKAETGYTGNELAKPLDGVSLYGSAMALKGTVLVGHNCDLKLYDTQHMRSSQELRWIDAVHAFDSSATGLSGCDLAAPDGEAAQSLSGRIPRSGLYFDSAFLPPKSERARAVDAFVLASANWKHGAPSSEKESNLCSDAPGTCLDSEQDRPVRARLQLFRTVEKIAPALENPLGGLVRSCLSTKLTVT